ncbi:Potassium voltage-gated channel sub H member 7 [Chytridiales sp. JEL 0842]|nr:Potassium voltage-gated channel sub H member 7 [Chytridiales sp. JEL 0842]
MNRTFTFKGSKASKLDLQIIRTADANSPTSNTDDKNRTTTQKIERPPHTLYERIVHALDILIPSEEAEDMEVPAGHFLQKVIVGKKWKWRIAKNADANLPEYLTEHKDVLVNYRVMMEEETFLPMVDPTSKFSRQWDALALILLLFTASVTPFETAFGGERKIDFMFLINLCVDLVFFIDIFVQFRTPFRDEQSGQVVRDEKAIAKNYAKSWFFLDLISILPIDMIGFNPNGDDSTKSSNLTQLRLLRFIRLARLLKLLRVLRASRKLRKWQVYINLRYAALQLAQYAFIIIFLIHWLACGYRLSSDGDSSEDSPGWVDRYASFKGVNGKSELNMWETYLLAIYWSSSTLSLVGPNFDVLSPSNVREYGYTLFANFVSYMNAVYFIAVLSDVLAVSSKIQRAHDLKVDHYLEMFDKLKLDMKLKVKVHDFLSEHFALAATSGYSSMLKELPAQLHGFISMEIFIEFISQLPFLEPFIEREPAMIQELCRNVEIRSFPPNSHVFTEGYEGIYYLERGVVAIEGVLYTT